MSRPFPPPPVADCDQSAGCPAAFHHGDCVRWQSSRIVIHVTEPPAPPVDPCTVGVHAWAWLARGGVECYRCGRRG